MHYIAEADLEKGVLPLHVEISPEEYQPELEKELRKTGRTLQIPGFRPGKVPRQLVLKQVGAELLRKILLNTSLQKLDARIREEKLSVIFEPIISGTNYLDAKPDEEKTYFFDFQVALFPDFELKWPEKGQFQLTVEPVTDDQVEAAYKARLYLAGHTVQMESIEGEGDVVQGYFFVSEDSEGSQPQRFSTAFGWGALRSEESQNFLKGKKSGDRIPAHPNDFFETPLEYVRIPQGMQEMLSQPGQNWVLEISQILRRVPAEPSADFFKKESGNDTLQTEEEFKEFLKQELVKRHQEEARYRAVQQIRDWLLNTYRERVPLPEKFIIRWMKAREENTQESKNWEEEFLKYKDNFIMEMVVERMAEELKISATSEEIQEDLDHYILNKLQRWGLLNVDQATFDQLRQKYRRDEKELSRARSRVIERKIMHHIFQIAVEQPSEQA
ncbi:MAG: trigger factor [Flavobacteriales bacterium]|nr:hypothetical protein [Flavobacteriales bacterium]MCX7649193.1 trigger factor [Flavobacteriales bacterium]MDW8431425.1 trigger factor [Flavobacteriales bacterium]